MGSGDSLETTFFIVGEYILLVIRAAGIAIFIAQSIKYSTLPRSQRDSYTVATLILLSLSLLCFFAYRLLTTIEEALTSYAFKAAAFDWYTRNGQTMAAVEAILRPLLSYLLQNLALIFNLFRWQALLEESKAELKSYQDQNYANTEAVEEELLSDITQGHIPEYSLNKVEE
jgi:hypothetical protein